MTVLSRKDARIAVGAMLAAALVGDGKPLQAFFNYEVGDWGTQDPVGYITGRGSARHDDNDAVKGVVTFGLDVHVWVRYVKDGVTEADSESTLDDVEALVADYVRDTESEYGFLGHDGESVVDAIELAGVEYRHEVIPLRLTIAEA